MHLHFVQSTEPLFGGGLGRAALELSSSLNIIGAPSILVSTADSAVRQDGVRIYERIGPTRLFYSNQLRREANSLVCAADVLHGHGFYVSPNWLFGRGARRFDRPLVYHPHGMFEPWILGRSRWKKRTAHWLFEDANFRYAQLWRALTGKEADQIRAQGISAPIIVCPNGIDLSVFEALCAQREVLARSPRQRTLLFLGRLHPKKGLDLMVSAWAAVPKSVRKGWRIVIAGPDELDHRAEIEALIASLQLDGEILFVGSVSGDAKLSVLAEATAFILPSRSEGFSVAILEAMACSLPVIATHACNFPSLATEGGGWICETEVYSIARALESLLRSDRNELEQRGVAGRRLVERDYAWPSIAKTMDDACRSILKR